MRIAFVAVLVAATATAAAADRATRALAAPSTIRDRVMVARFGVSGLAADELAAHENGDGDPWLGALPVVAMTDDAAQVVIDSDGARLLVWVAATDLTWTVARPTRLRGAGAVGVWALPGAPLTVTGDGAQVAVRWDGVGVTIDATVARTALVHRFRPAAIARRSTDGATATFHASPDGPPLIAFGDPVSVRITARGPAGWVRVEHVEPTLRVVGWARRAELTKAMAIGTLTGTGIRVGSDTRMPPVTLAAGTCLFDERGVPVGVQLAAGTRPGADLGDGRWAVVVSTPWRWDHAFVVDRHPGRGAPTWRRCR